mgnify:CR=1 FL=1
MGREDARGKGKVYKLAFIDPMCDVTFLCPNKKVTKEVVRGEALRANASSPRTPLPPRKPPPTENVPIFSGLCGTNLQLCRMQAFKNRNIFECWMAMRRGIVKGAHLLVAPLYSASFGPFLAETRKGRITSVRQIGIYLILDTFLLTNFARRYSRYPMMKPNEFNNKSSTSDTLS